MTPSDNFKEKKMFVEKIIHIPVMVRTSRNGLGQFFIPVKGMCQRPFDVSESSTIDRIVLNIAREYAFSELMTDFDKLEIVDDSIELPEDFKDKRSVGTMYVRINTADLYTNHVVQLPRCDVPFDLYIKLQGLCKEFQAKPEFVIIRALEHIDTSSWKKL